METLIHGQAKNVIIAKLERKNLMSKELEALLHVFYQSGYKQEQLFSIKDNKDFKDNKKFRALINKEAKNRNLTPYELISYFAENKEELIELLEKKDIKYPKFSKIYTHSETEKIMKSVLITHGQGLHEKAIKDNLDNALPWQNGDVKIWEGKGIDYIVGVGDLIKLEGKPPKVYVSQAKNILLLMGMIQEQQFNKEVKEAICRFKLSYYAERRGYTAEEIAGGGNFYNELKRDLLSGALTRYGKILIKGKKYTVYNSFYGLYMPDDPGEDWIVEFNNPYKDHVLQILNKEARQHFIKSTKAIEDRTTTEKPYLFLFYQQLTDRKRANLITTPLKVGSLLADMKLQDKILARPKECFKILKECLLYFSEHYQPYPEIEEFNIYNDFHQTKTIKLPLHISEAFRECNYEDFKDHLQAIGIKDIREAYISFKRPYIKPVDKFVLTDKDEQLIEEIMAWVTEWEEYQETHEIPFTKEEQHKFLLDCIRYLGHDRVEESFYYEQEREKEGVSGSYYHVDDPIGYFTKRLPEMLKEDKASKNK